MQLFETVVNTRVFAETLNFRGGQKTFGQILIIGQADRAVTLSWQQARLWWGLTGFSSVFNWRPPLVAADTVLALPALRVFAPAYIIVFEGVIFPAIFTFATIAEHIL